MISPVFLACALDVVDKKLHVKQAYIECINHQTLECELVNILAT